MVIETEPFEYRDLTPVQGARLCELYSRIWLTAEEKARKNLSQGSRRVPVGTVETEYTELNIHNDT